MIQIDRARARLRAYYGDIIRSIGFYPTLITFGFFGLGLLMVYLEGVGISGVVLEKFPYIIIRNKDTARLFLNTLATGILSLTVFSFSMIMIVINQAASMYSPRIVPGLITNKRHQVILGVYVGTLIYTLLVMINVEPRDLPYLVPGTAIFIGLIWGIVCIALFVYFIHSISESVEIANILNGIYKETSRGLKREIEARKIDKMAKIPETSGWMEYECLQSGYLQEVAEENLVKLAQKNDFVIQIVVPLGTYVLKDNVLFRTSEALKEKDLKESVMTCFLFDEVELVSQNYLFGFKQITEIAVKALSPGINDPGTAINAIDYLADLFALSLSLSGQKLLFDSEGSLRVIFYQVSLDDMLYFCLAPLREYGKNDVLVTFKLMSAMKGLIVIAKNRSAHLKTLLKHTAVLIDDADHHIKSGIDRDRLNDLIRRINDLSGARLSLLVKDYR